jgi:hypothetical protein
MTETLDFLTPHGTWVLFLAVFMEQIGIPPRPAPWSPAAGPLTRTGKTSIPGSLAPPLESPKSFGRHSELNFPVLLPGSSPTPPGNPLDQFTLPTNQIKP